MSRDHQRVIGYCGPGDTARRVWAAAAHAPGLWAVAAPREQEDSPASAFALLGEARPQVLHASTEDGSFLLLDGEFLGGDARTDAASQALTGFRTRGPRLLEGLRFTGLLAAWDAPSRRLVVLRDRFGIAPGYVAPLDGGAAFASRVDTLVRYAVEPRLDAVGLAHFLTFGYFPAPSSPIEGIIKIPPAHAVHVVDGVMGLPQRWAPHPWAPDPDAESPRIPAARGAEVLREGLERALRRMSWEGRAGLLLSGGVDSAALLAFIRRVLGADVHAFTFRYEDYRGRLNEGDQARQIAQHLGVPHREIPISPDDLWSDLGDAAAAYGEPPGWGLHSYRLGPLTERGITTLFSGVHGWALPRRLEAALRFRRLPWAARAAVRAGAPLLRRVGLNRRGRMGWLVREVADLAELYYPERSGRYALTDVFRDRDITEVERSHALDLLHQAAAEYTGLSDERALILLDKRFNAAEAVLQWNTAWSRVHGFRLRLPYMDEDLVDAIMRLEGNEGGKDHLRRLALEHLPREIAYAPKVPQEIPVAEWLRGSLADPVRSRLSSLPAALAATLDPAGVDRLVVEHTEGRADHGWTITALLTTAAWWEWITAARAKAQSR